MKLPLVSLNYNFKTNFKANNTDGKTPSDAHQSKQNNSMDTFIPTKTYLNMLTARTMKSAANQYKSGDVKEIERIKEIRAKASQCGITSPDERVEIMALSILYGLKIYMDTMEQIPDNLKGKIPNFFSLGIEDVLETVAKSGFPTVVSVIDNKKVDNSEIIKPILNYLIKEKYEDIQETAQQMSNKANFKLYNAIIAGFNRNAREVVNSISEQALNWIEPTIQDNDNGTQTCTYKYASTCLVTTINKVNKDYIGASVYSDNKMVAFVKFREDGSIMKLNLAPSNKEEYISMSSNEDNNEITIKHHYPDKVDTKIYRLQEDGTLEPLSQE